MKISDMMDTIRDDTVPVQLQDVASTQRIKEAAIQKIREAGTPNKRPRKSMRLLFVAAILVTAFSTAAFSIYQLSKEDYRGSKKVTILDIPNGVPEYEAGLEWQRRSQEIHNEVDFNSPDLENPDYWGYNQVQAYTQEARDIVDEILEKYDLKLMQPRQSTQSLAEFYDFVGVSGFLPEEGPSELYPAFPVGFGYHGGAHFSAFGIARLPDGRDFLYRFNSAQKGIFQRSWNEMYRNVDDLDWWSYIRKDGTEVLLSMEKDTSFMRAVLDNAYISVLICSGTENSVETTSDAASFAKGMPTVNKETLEELAECFDFAIINSLAE